jgi:hypothetical protein
MQLPAYLRRVAQEQRELPADVLEVTNALRAARGEPALPPPEAVLPGEFPELAAESGDTAADASEEEIQLLRKARQRFQVELLGVLRKDAPAERLHALGRLFGSLAQRQRPGGQRLMWQACAAACDAALQGGSPACARSTRNSASCSRWSSVSPDVRHRNSSTAICSPSSRAACLPRPA